MSLNPHWKPTAGVQSSDLDQRLFARIPDAGQRAAVFDTAGRILGHGPRAHSADPSVTGLALGYVQSGKTTSFTALSALAADNGYKIIIAFLGKTNLLTDMNTQELRELLGVNDEDGWDYRWSHLEQPGSVQASAASQDLQAGRILLITLLKLPQHIRNVVKLLKDLPESKYAPCLVIDDEADQASLNTFRASGKQSSTYTAIKHLTKALGPHLYIQYTATPFAPLLLEPDDKLSPSFVEQLTPGPAYVGGEEFFVNRQFELVRGVSDAEAVDDNPKQLPQGLRDALQSFFISAALLKAGNIIRPPVSMLVHPSHLREVHRDYYRLVVLAHGDWRHRIHRPSGDPGREQDLATFHNLYLDLAKHSKTPTLAWEDVIPSLVSVLDSTKFWLVNSEGDARKIDWKRGPVHVLVGGNILDRGFVIKGLTTTYLTRHSRVSQADTVEQRARCFGYKRSYLDYCRFYAPKSVTDAFTSLVHTEADLRARLLDWVDAGEPLAKWATEVGLVLPSNMQPARRNVLPPIVRFNIAGPYHSQRTPSLLAESISANADLVAATGILEAPLRNFGSLSHRVLDDVDVEKIISPLLENWAPGETPGFPLNQLKLYVLRRWEAGKLRGMTVVHLDNRGSPRRHGWRGDALGMVNLMQGSDRGTGYPGDNHLFPDDRAQLQIHHVQAMRSDGSEFGPPCFTLVLHIPDDGTFPKTVALQDAIAVAL